MSLRMIIKEFNQTVVMGAVTPPSVELEGGGKVVCPADLLREM